MITGLLGITTRYVPDMSLPGLEPQHACMYALQICMTFLCLSVIEPACNPVHMCLSGCQKRNICVVASIGSSDLPQHSNHV